MHLKGFCTLRNIVKHTVWNCSATLKNRLVTVFLATTWVDIATSKPWRISLEIWTWQLRRMCECEAKISSSVNHLKRFCSWAQSAKKTLSGDVYGIYSIQVCWWWTYEGVQAGWNVTMLYISYICLCVTGLQLIHISGCKEFKWDISKL